MTEEEAMDAGALRKALERIDREESAAYGKIGTLLSTADHIAVMNALVPMSEAILDAIDLAAARGPVAPAEAEPPGLRAALPSYVTAQVLDQWEASAIEDEARGTSWAVNPTTLRQVLPALRAALAQPPAPVSAEAAWLAPHDIAFIINCIPWEREDLRAALRARLRDPADYDGDEGR